MERERDKNGEIETESGRASLDFVWIVGEKEGQKGKEINVDRMTEEGKA